MLSLHTSHVVNDIFIMYDCLYMILFWLLLVMTDIEDVLTNL